VAAPRPAPRRPPPTSWQPCQGAGAPACGTAPPRRGPPAAPRARRCVRAARACWRRRRKGSRKDRHRRRRRCCGSLVDPILSRCPCGWLAASPSALHSFRWVRNQNEPGCLGPDPRRARRLPGALGGAAATQRPQIAAGRALTTERCPCDRQRRGQRCASQAGRARAWCCASAWMRLRRLLTFAALLSWHRVEFLCSWSLSV
jgi:hypothetical protein